MNVFAELSGPIRGTLSGLPVMIIGVFADASILCIDSEGIVKHVDLDGNVKADVIFDYKKREWVDLQPMTTEAE